MPGSFLTVRGPRRQRSGGSELLAASSASQRGSSEPREKMSSSSAACLGGRGTTDVDSAAEADVQVLVCGAVGKELIQQGQIQTIEDPCLGLLRPARANHDV